MPSVYARAVRRAAEIAGGVNQLSAEWHVPIEKALEMEAEAQARCMETNDFKRAFEAFAAKQTPVFKGD